ncbi:MAG: hypothetical protein HPY45_06265 [Anaerolineae bacterium]|nr:hypothetical protein [Anaerolineae bacterium]
MKLKALLLAVFLLSLAFFVTQCSAPPEPVATQQPAAPAQSVEQAAPATAPAEPSAPQAPATEEVAPQATEASLAQETVNVQQLAEERCSACHSFDRVKAAKKSADEWAATVKRMVKKGAQLSETEQELVIKYLSETYPK